ncbi:MAG: hypothetical protein IPL50_18580 [Chitinophagaceae bacterium]|nr:hypothetical protein [Chitinophagaceae bacterium]
MQIAIATNTLAGNGKAVKLAAKILGLLNAEKYQHRSLPKMTGMNACINTTRFGSWVEMEP